MNLAFGGRAALRPGPVARPVKATAIAVGVLWLVAIAMLAARSPARGAGTLSSAWWCMAGMSLGRASSVGALSATLGRLPMAATMTCAMTLPAALPAVHHVAFNSLTSRQPRAVAEFLAVYVGLWLAFVSVATLGLSVLGSSTGGLLCLAAALAICTVWDLTAYKLRALNRCHRSRPLPPRGLKASVGVSRFAFTNATGCIGTCAPGMVVMLIVPRWQIGWMIGLTTMALYEKLSRAPRKATRRTSGVYAAATVVVVLLA